MEQSNPSDKKKKIIILVTTLILFIGISFAFIAAQLSGGAIGNANVTADTTDNLQFSVDKDIYLNPTQFNVVEGGGGLSDTAVGTASLIANSTNNEASATYNVYFRVNTNEYIYTTEDNKPEIVLTITDPTGTPITSVDGLTYVTAENADGSEVSGFDITTEMGLFTIATDYGITSASSINATEQDWTFTVTFINLTTNQTENSGGTLDAEIILETEERYTLANYIIDNVYVEDRVNGLYYHDGLGTYMNADQEAGDNSYRYAGANYIVAAEYIDEYSDINNFVIDINNGGAYVYKNKAYSMVDDNALEKMNLLIYEDFAIEYCNVNACDYEEILNQILNDTIEDENVEIAAGEFRENLLINGEWASVISDYLIEYNGEILFGAYNIYKYLAKEFCTINSCDADTVYNDWIYGVENDLTSGLDTYVNENFENILAESTKLNYLLAYDASVAFETYDEAVNYAINDGALLTLNNYVCFASDEEVCPLENLYRIIGVFNDTGEYQVKLIKAEAVTSDMLGTNSRDYYGTYIYNGSNYKGSMDLSTIAAYYWNSDKTNIVTDGEIWSNNWALSEFNTINLNTNYWNYLGADWQKLIAPTTWHLGGMTLSDTNTPKAFYDGERSNNVYGNNPTTYTDEIGLMYPSDYGYAAIPYAWTINLSYYPDSTITSNHWIDLGLYEWTITPHLYYASYVFNVNGIFIYTISTDYPFAARPVFYLKPNVELAGGTGSPTDPYRLVV